jgi:transposase
MARYKEYCYEQTKLIPIAFSQQILPGTFEYTLNYLIDNEFDLTPFEQRYHNDETGAPAYDPAILLKIILYAYSRGMTSSRQIERCCGENIIFMALSADTHPHFTTIADFVSSRIEEIIELFCNVLLICEKLGFSRQRDVRGGRLQAGLECFQGVERDQRGVKEKAREDGKGRSLPVGEAPADGLPWRDRSSGGAGAKADRDLTGEGEEAQELVKTERGKDR